ncbi:sarcinarray family MAST domain-containing protein [Methanomethylovorans sp.]|uniref:sarcinarray family MAST domain-containing protein n=1 Tax=Methanomethylovorans sp. TaxID=2758717 RepID=UPI00351BFE8C
MKNKLLGLCIAVCLLSMPVVVAAESPYAKIDVYYNGKLYSGSAIPKPLLKIGELFTVRFDVTSYQRCYLSVQLGSIDKNDFKIISGPTSKMNQFTDEIIEKNETKSYEWIIAPTDNWAGGGIPLDFYYQFTDLETIKTITSGEFTAAYVTVSEEYYEGDTVETVTEPTTEETANTPGFILPLAVGMVLLAGICRRNI